jgi:hypothetical protein
MLIALGFAFHQTAALSLSWPAQASLALRPAGSLSLPKATFVTRLQPRRLPDKAARQLQDLSTSIRVNPSPTDHLRRRAAQQTQDTSCRGSGSTESLQLLGSFNGLAMQQNCAQGRHDSCKHER